MAVALKGNLADFGVAEIFQLIGHQRKTGLLEISGPKGPMRVAFDSGALVFAVPVGDSSHAALGDFLVRCGLLKESLVHEKIREGRASARSLPDLLVADGLVCHEDIESISDLITRETLFVLMAMTGGSFEFLPGPETPSLAPGKMMVAEQVLMDGMRMQDEWLTFARELPGEAEVLEILVPVDDYCDRLEDGGQGGSDRVRRVSDFVNGKNSVRQIIDRSRLGTFAAGRILVDLRRAGLMDTVSPELRKGGKARRSGGKRVVALARLALAAGAPLILLGTVTAGIFLQSLDARFGRGQSIAYRPLEEARAQFARQRLHNHLEARRHGTGRWPHGLDFLSQGAWGEEEGLTSESASAYYYMRRGDGIVLLAPRR